VLVTFETIELTAGEGVKVVGGIEEERTEDPWRYSKSGEASELGAKGTCLLPISLPMTGNTWMRDPWM
jgi:hypothetical protein